MPKKIKLNLDELNVKSFATTNLRGGAICEESVSSCGPGDGTTGGEIGTHSGDGRAHCMCDTHIMCETYDCNSQQDCITQQLC